MDHIGPPAKKLRQPRGLIGDSPSTSGTGNTARLFDNDPPKDTQVTTSSALPTRASTRQKQVSKLKGKVTDVRPFIFFFLVFFIHFFPRSLRISLRILRSHFRATSLAGILLENVQFELPLHVPRILV